MKGAAEVRSELVMSIISGNISISELEKEISSLEEIYGAEAFTAYQMTRRPRPWSEDYYEKLEKQAISGAGSKEFILHLYEVRTELQKSGHGSMIKTIILVCTVMIVIAVIAFIATR